MTVKTQLRLTVFVLLFSLFTLTLQPARAQSEVDPPQVIANAVTYLKTQQQPDGGILGFAGTSDPDTTARTLLALAVNQQTLADLTSAEGKTLVDYLASQAEAYVHDPNGLLFPGRAGLLLTAVVIANQDVHNFGGVDLVSELAASYQPDSAAYATEAALDYSSGAASDLNQAWAILGLSLAGQPIPTPATFYLAGTQAEDGSWGSGDLDTTALVVNALLASRNVPLDDAMITKALGFFKSTQLPNGGWRPSWDQDPLNADTTGWVALSLAAARQTPLEQTWAAAQGDPFSALYSLAKEDGSIGGTYVNAYSTADALIGLGQTPFPSLGMLPNHQRAALVIQNGDATLLTACIAFTEESLSGFELLNRSKLEIASVTDPSLGTAVCGIGAEGCPSTECFCGMPNYWSYWQQVDGDWAYAVSGSEQSVVKDGGIEAWSWGEGTPPALLTFTQVCQPGSVPPASVAQQSQSAAPTAYPEPPAVTLTAAVQSYPEPAATATTALQSYPEPTAQSEASTSSSLASALPYLILLVIVVGLFIGVLVLARRKK
jgi:hypothetical protein